MSENPSSPRKLHEIAPDVAARLAGHPANSLAASVIDRIRDARERGYTSGYRVGYVDARRALIPYAGGLLCLGVAFGGIAVLMFLRLSA